MQELYRSPYSVVLYDSSKSLVEFTYNASTQRMTVEEYKTDITAYFDSLVKYKPQRMLSDLQQMYFSITPEIQDWINSSLVTKLPNNPNSKSALVMSPDIFTQVSIEQTVEDSLKTTNNRVQESEQAQSGLRYFPDRASAIAWLLK